MMLITLFSVFGCLLAQQITGYAPVAQQPMNAQDGTQGVANAPTEAGVAGKTLGPNIPTEVQPTNSSTRHRGNGLPFPLSWFSPTPNKPTTKEVSEMMRVPVADFSNIYREKHIQNPYIEVQKSVDAYADDTQKALVHFSGPANLQEGPVNVQSLKLVLHRVLSGENYDMTCPSKSIKISHILPPNGQGVKDVKVLEPSLTVEVSNEMVTCDLTNMFKEAPAGTMNYRDFWLMIETDPQCYYAFDPSPTESAVTVSLLRTITVYSQSSRMSFAPFIVLAVIGLGGLVYMFRRNKTDYTYFQDHGDLVVDA